MADAVENKDLCDQLPLSRLGVFSRSVSLQLILGRFSAV